MARIVLHIAEIDVFKRAIQPSAVSRQRGEERGERQKGSWQDFLCTVRHSEEDLTLASFFINRSRSMPMMCIRDMLHA